MGGIIIAEIIFLALIHFWPVTQPSNTFRIVETDEEIAIQAPVQTRQQSAPPPPPVEHVWHIAENGQTHGPYSKAALGRMASDGKLTRDSHVWTAGQDGWLKAGDVQELAQLFTILPPPPPGA